jgi:pyridoxal phosphate enzyme (YggS family)
MQVAERLDRVWSAIEAAAQKSGRKACDITLVAVSKKKPLNELLDYEQAARAKGIPVVFGENYLQELKGKRDGLGSGIEIHMIGPLQSNKVKEAVRCCDLIESVHTTKILMLIAEAARSVGKVQKILLQVNIGDDPNKSGFGEDRVREAIEMAALNSDALELVGLMTITPFEEDPEMARRYFTELADLRRDLINQGLAEQFSHGRIRLSMGMSADFALAIEEGADFVRIGTALFGDRTA